ncbi:MAG: imidazoleglycerol-phosphate dehydratase HisB [Clostridia bacterium]
MRAANVRTPTAVTRTTRETDVQVILGSDAPGLDVAVPIFQHFLNACLTTWGCPARVEARGDVDVDPHHLVEDVGLVLGRALAEHWPGYRDIARYGWAVVAMDDARAEVALDLSGRAGCWLEKVPDGAVNGLESEVLGEFWQGVARGGELTLHLNIPAGNSRHHRWEAAFKALGLALRQATEPREGTLSTKGVIRHAGRDH